MIQIRQLKLVPGHTDRELMEKAAGALHIRPEEISGMLSCLQAKEREFPKGAVLYRAGAHVHELGIVLSGSVSIERDDLWGNHMLLDRVGPGQIFAETYACLPEEALMINAVALEKSRIRTQ